MNTQYDKLASEALSFHDSGDANEIARNEKVIHNACSNIEEGSCRALSFFGTKLSCIGQGQSPEKTIH